MSPRQLAALKGALFLLALLPLLQLLIAAGNHELGAKPIETIARHTGSWTFNFLLITLAVTPLRKVAHWPWLIRLRRMFGLFTFFYAGLHAASFLWLDHDFDPVAIAQDVVERPFVVVGFAAFVLLIPLALTSSNAAVRRLGGKRWQQLHYTIYPIGILAAIHYGWQVDAAARPVALAYALILAALLGWRARERMRRFGPFPREQDPAAPPKAKVVKFMPRPRHK